MMRICYAVMMVAIFAGSTWAAERPTFNDKDFQEQIRSLKNEHRAEERQRRAHGMIPGHRFSSQQVKAIAAQLKDDAARLDFATAAYPLTVDPENFYDVYDAFTTFSHVMRLHDRIQSRHRPATAPVVMVPRVISDDDMKDILGAIRKESFDNTKMQLARQIVGSSRGNFLSRQIKELCACFSFDNARLEFAKFAYDYTLDQEKYFLVNDAFSFTSNKEVLSRYVESRKQDPPAGRRR